jgi:AI-2 transport protein TqsA
VLCSLGAFIGALWLCADLLAARAPKYRDALAQLADDVLRWGQHLGLPEDALRGRTSHVLDALGSAASGAAAGIASMLGAFVLVVTFAMLALSETDAWQRKLRAQWGEHGLETASTISSRCRAYVVTRTFTSAATGLLTGLLAWAVGLDLAFVWGVTAFVLNYIPTLGSIIAIIPPTILAMVQLGGLGAFGLFVGLTLIQVTIGSFLDPKLQGRTLQLSPIVILFSIGLWGYIWGVAGALLAVPLTMAIAVVCSQFPRSRWVASMLAEDAEEPKSRARSREQARGQERPLSSDVQGGAV